MSPSYAELHCLSNFTFLRGASHPEELIETAHGLGYRALALTDECSLAGAVRAHIAAKDKGLKLILGSELVLERDHGPTRLLLLATDRAGYGNLSALITRGRRQAAKGNYRLTRADFAAHSGGCLAILLPPARMLAPARAGADDEPPAVALEEQLEWLCRTLPASAWLGIELLGEPGDRARLAMLQALGRQYGLPCVACGDVHMHVRERRILQDTLTAIRLKCTLAEAGYRLHPNGERHLRSRERLARIYPPKLLAETVAIAERCTFSLDSLRYEYPEELVPAGETPASHLRKLTARGFLRRFGASLEPPCLPARSSETTLSALRPASPGWCNTPGVCRLGRAQARPAKPRLHSRPGGDMCSPRLSRGGVATDADGAVWGCFETTPCASTRAGLSAAHEHAVAGGATDIDKVRTLIEHELALIAELGYEPYFLTVHDIVAFARSREILCQGRGSAANSAVCYCLGITEVDPGRMQMLFERFISRERNEPPDIDVDFEHQRREEVMQYVYSKYGRDRAALAATLISYRPKSAVRDVGKALGLELAQVDRLAKSLAWWDRRDAIAQRIREAGLDPESPVMQRLVGLVESLLGFPRHLSQHVGGFVISRGPLDRMVPIENAAMPERTVIQWDKDDLDALGLLKVDCLALGMLSAIRRALDLVSDWRSRFESPLTPGPSSEGSGEHPGAGRKFTMADVPAEDPAVYAMIRQADTIGVFQIESRAQMSMLPRLAPETFYDLVIEVAIVRPGPIQGGMIHPYLRRRQKQEAVTYPSEAVREVLERTLGVPIFQEQVMQLAIVAAGFTPGEADQLRRSMAAWRRKGGLGQFEQRLISGMSSRGYKEEFARQIFQQILGFGEYGFPESHSASFALLVYVSSWLKCHHPAAFTCALLNAQPMGFYAPSQLVQDARRHGVEVRPVDVASSDWDCTLEDPLAASASPSVEGIAPVDWREEVEHHILVNEGRDVPADGMVAPGAAEQQGEVILLQPHTAPSASAATPPRERRGEHISPPGRECSRGFAGRACARPSRQTPGVLHHPGLAGRQDGVVSPPCQARAGPQGEVVSASDRERSPALRLGMRMINGISEAAALRIMAARRSRMFDDVQDLARRAELNRHDLNCLARAGALNSIAGHRRNAIWSVAGIQSLPPLLARAPSRETPARLTAPTEAQEIVADYRSLGLSLQRHPLELLRPRLERRRLLKAAQIQQLPHGRIARAAGIVTCRQRPDTASGVIFITLEDESGYLNVVVWHALMQRQRREVLSARLLGVYGTIERQAQVVHLIAGRLVDLSPMLGALDPASRDFH